MGKQKYLRKMTKQNYNFRFGELKKEFGKIINFKGYVS